MKEDEGWGMEEVFVEMVARVFCGFCVGRFEDPRVEWMERRNGCVERDGEVERDWVFFVW